ERKRAIAELARSTKTRLAHRKRRPRPLAKACPRAPRTTPPSSLTSTHPDGATYVSRPPGSAIGPFSRVAREAAVCAWPFAGGLATLGLTEQRERGMAHS